VLIGCGGHASVVLDAVVSRDPAGTVSVFDANPQMDGAIFLGTKVSAPFDPAALGAVSFHVSIGDNAARQRLFKSIMDGGGLPVSIVHPRASISQYCNVDSGCFVAAGAIVGPRTFVGRGVIVNHCAVIDHDCEIMDFCHIAPGAILGGDVKLGECSFIGANATILPGVRIGSNVIVGAGATVTKDIPNGETWIGSPAARKVSKGNA
jgi:sugar O-acyltransferase (sialic acid O-acetyltransferase NeuD family)